MKVAFVVHRYGDEVCGGAEIICRQVAERMVRHWDVEVLTTCAVDDNTWENVFPAGTARVRGVVVRRFPVDHPRDMGTMEELGERVYSRTGTPQDDVRWMVAYGPYSRELLRHLKTRADEYDFVIFFTYVFALSAFGIPLVQQKCALVPTAHDEPEIYIRLFRAMFRSVRALLFLSAPEQTLVNQLFETDGIVQGIVGVGFELPSDISGERFRASRRSEVGDKAMLLYAGRINERKGCGTLISHFIRFCSEVPDSSLVLVLIGATSMRMPEHQRVRHLGYVTERDKFDAFAAATVVVQPSPYESLSMVALEAWALEKPMLVNGDCEVLRDQCLRSNGGLWYETYEEFREELSLLSGNAELRAQLGRSGREYVVRNYRWDTVESRYIEVVRRALARASDAACARAGLDGARERWIGRDLLARLETIRGSAR